MTRRFAIALLALLAGLGVWGALHRLLGRTPDDAERIRELFAEAARAAEERRVSDAVEGLSERFRSQDGLDKRDVKRLVLAQVLRGEWVSISVTGSQISVEGDAAEAVVDVVMARSGKGKRLADLLPAEASAMRLRCRLEREEGGWRIVSASRREIPLAEALAGPPQ